MRRTSLPRLATLALLALATPVTAATLPAARMSVESRAGAYQVRGGFVVAASAESAWAVLTDYENLPSFVSSMRRSTRAAGPGGVTILTQEAVGKAGPFSRTLYVALEVREDAPRRLAFRDTSGRSFTSYAGSWTIEPDPSGVRVSYALDAEPHAAPPLFARSILARNARALLEEVRDEIARRAALSGGRRDR